MTLNLTPPKKNDGETGGYAAHAIVSTHPVHGVAVQKVDIKHRGGPVGLWIHNPEGLETNSKQHDCIPGLFSQDRIVIAPVQAAS